MSVYSMSVWYFQWCELCPNTGGIFKETDAYKYVSSMLII